jgi:MerR family transcriptional regulator, light-induced transcriptional regulator
MSLFPISAVAKRTGIALDTLRAWERRYEAVAPKRGPRGRMYSAEQVERLLLLRRAVQQGHAIGQVAKLSGNQLRKLVDHQALAQTTHTTRPPAKAARPDTERDFLQPVLNALDRYDYLEAEREINRLATAMARPREFVYLIALPLMRTIGQMWHAGTCSIAQEHMLTHLLSSVLSSMLRAYTPTNPPARVLVATPYDDRHAFPTLVAAMLTSIAGLGVVYLGADLPSDDIVQAARRSNSDAVLLSLSTTPSSDTLEEIDLIARKLHRTKALWLGGAPELGINSSTLGARWKWISDFKTLEHHLHILGKSA